ncbi:hypothetical protein ACH5RR_034826 [Cinchona calisaya]|uniref:Vesicle-fusing ATPase n=1 Tax=Cinchona calisaya TaxID=153742 RepID=A0ABD2YGJ0_9GENT
MHDATVEKGKLALTKQQCAFAKLKSGDQVELTVCTQPLKVYNKLEVEMELESPAGLTVKPHVYAFDLAWKVQMTLHEQAVLEGQYMTILNDGIPWLCTIIHGTGGGSTRLKQGVVDYSKTKVFVEITEGQPVIGCGVAKTVLKEKLDVAGVEAKLESMGIVGMTSPILEIIRPAFLSRMMTTGRVMRSGRMELQLSVDLPDGQTLIKMLDMLIQDMGLPLEDSVNLQELALMTEGCSGADLTSIINHARDSAVAKPGLLGLAHQSEIVLELSSKVPLREPQPPNGNFNSAGQSFPASSSSPTASLTKPRMRWTPELHEIFVKAVNKLGGSESA